MRAKDYAKFIGEFYLGYYKDKETGLDLPAPVKLLSVYTVISSKHRQRGDVGLEGRVHGYDELTGEVKPYGPDSPVVDFNPDWLKVSWNDGWASAEAKAKGELRQRLVRENAVRCYTKLTGKDAKYAYGLDRGWHLNMEEWLQIEATLEEGGWKQWPLLSKGKS